MTLLLKEEITFPRWDGDPEFDPYCTYKVLADTLKYGRSLVAPVDRDAFRHVFSFWPPLSRVIGGQAEDELDAASVKRMTLPKLKAALSERGLDATGPKGSVKATLRERLLGFIESSPW